MFEIVVNVILALMIGMIFKSLGVVLFFLGVYTIEKFLWWLACRYFMEMYAYFKIHFIDRNFMYKISSTIYKYLRITIYVFS